jgi:hypothetical protein
MFKRLLALGLCALLVALLVSPAGAQPKTQTAADYVPASFAGFIRVRVSNPTQTLSQLNLSAFLAAVAQPTRINLSSRLGYDDFIPLGGLFEIDGVSFTQDIVPWVKDEFVLAYRQIDSQLKTKPADVLLILPTDDVFKAASGLSGITGAPGAFRKDEYDGVQLYVGDRGAIALTPLVVFVGGTDAVKAALDIQAGNGKSLTAEPAYQAVREASAPNPLVFGYVTGDNAVRAAGAVLSGAKQTEPLLSAFGRALNDNRSGFGKLLAGALDGVGVSIDLNEAGTAFTADVTFHSREDAFAGGGKVDPALLELVPRTAMLVHGGSDLPATIREGLLALPLSNFSGDVLGGLSTRPVADSNPLISPPTADDLRAAVNSFLDVLSSVNGFSLDKDLLAHLSGGYVVALLPRPNTPTPVINTPFDVLLVAKVSDEVASVKGAAQFLSAVFRLDTLDPETVAGWDFMTLGLKGGEAVFHIGAKDSTLILASGGAAQSALNAGRGSNRLIDQDAWKALSKDATPELYVDTVPFYNTFYPSPGGMSNDPANQLRLAAHSGLLQDGLSHLVVTVSLPQQ